MVGSAADSGGGGAILGRLPPAAGRPEPACGHPLRGEPKRGGQGHCPWPARGAFRSRCHASRSPLGPDASPALRFTEFDTLCNHITTDSDYRFSALSGAGREISGPWRAGPVRVIRAAAMRSRCRPVARRQPQARAGQVVRADRAAPYALPPGQLARLARRDLRSFPRGTRDQEPRTGRGGPGTPRRPAGRPRSPAAGRSWGGCRSSRPPPHAAPEQRLHIGAPVPGLPGLIANLRQPPSPRPRRHRR